MDPRYQQLAKLLVRYSAEVKPGDRVLLMTDISTPFEMNKAVIDEVHRAGGFMLDPMVWDQRLMAAARKGCHPRQLRVDAAAYFTKILGTDCRIALRGYMNPLEMKDVPAEDSQRHNQIFADFVMEEAIEGTRWVLTEWPTPGFALLGNFSTSEAEDFFFKAALVDYRAMARNVKPLVELMEKTNEVKITGPGTNLKFLIKGIPVVPCVGKRNVPDGEIYTAPIRDSMNGVITYNTPTITKDGEKFEGVSFTVKNGKIVKASCKSGDPERLQGMLDTDEGARYFGEFSLGVNTGISRVIGDTLFDEKVWGTFHLTPGKCYESAPNGNKSAIHWDIVLDQRQPAGGGEIRFDNKLIRKNGFFVPKSLQALNPKL